MAKVKTKKKKGKLVGKTSGLGVLATWAKLFAENESSKNHLTDEQILARMKKEFPGHEKESRIFSSVTAHRRFYNTGRLPGGRPRTKSKKYGD